MVKLSQDKLSPHHGRLSTHKKRNQKAEIEESVSPTKIKSELMEPTGEDDFQNAVDQIEEIESPKILDKSGQSIKKKKKSLEKVTPVKQELEDDEEIESPSIKRKKIGKKVKKEVEDDDEEEIQPKKKTKLMKQAEEIAFLKAELERLKKMVEKKPINDSEKKQPTTPHDRWHVIPYDGEILEETKQRIRDRDSRVLFVTHPAKDLTEDELKSLSTDIITIYKPPRNHDSAAYLRFASEEICKTNLEKLNGTKIHDGQLKAERCLDYENAKSSRLPIEERKINSLKLEITGLPLPTTVEDLKPFFPTASLINRHAKIGSMAFALFESAQVARQAFLNAKDLVVNGTKVTVLYSAAGNQYTPGTSQYAIRKPKNWRN